MYEGEKEIEKRQNFSYMHMMHHAEVLWNPLAGRWTRVPTLASCPVLPRPVQKSNFLSVLASKEVWSRTFSKWGKGAPCIVL